MFAEFAVHNTMLMLLLSVTAADSADSVDVDAHVHLQEVDRCRATA